ncbi:MAG TPA: hypothetical protein VF283_23590 [Bryobacteraceae bacterium]
MPGSADRGEVEGHAGKGSALAESLLTLVTSASRPSATALQRAGGECEVFPAASAVSVPAGHPVGDREARIQIDNGKEGVK